MEVCNNDITGGVCHQRRWVHDEGEIGAPWVNGEQGTCAYDTEGVWKGKGGCV